MLDMFEITLTYVRNAFVLVVFVMYVYNFLKGDKLYKILTLYVVLSLYKIVSNYYVEFFTWYLLLQILILSCFYHLLFVNKIQRIVTTMTTVVVMALFVIIYMFGDKISDNIINENLLLYTFIVIAVFTLIHKFNETDTPTNYVYFNNGLFLFLVLNVIINLILQVVYLFTKNNIFNAKIVNITVVTLDIMFQLFLVKQWFVVNKKNNQKIV